MMSAIGTAGIDYVRRIHLQYFLEPPAKQGMRLMNTTRTGVRLRFSPCCIGERLGRHEGTATVSDNRSSSYVSPQEALVGDFGLPVN